MADLRPAVASGGVPEDGQSDVEASRPAAVTAAGLILLVAGALAALIGTLFLIYAGLYQDPAALPDWVELGQLPALDSGRLVVLGVLALVYGLAQVATGIAVTSGRAWARMTGIGLALAGAVLAVGGLLPRAGGSLNPVFVPVVVAHLYAAWALVAHRSWFAPGEPDPSAP